MEDNIKIKLTKTRLEGADWTQVVVDMTMITWVPYKVGNFFLRTVVQKVC